MAKYTCSYALIIVFTKPMLLTACDQNNSENSGPHIPETDFMADIEKANSYLCNIAASAME